MYGPTFESLSLLFWMSAIAATATAVLGIPMLRMREYAVEADRPRAEYTGAITQVVLGQVVNVQAQPVRNAVVTVLTPDGRAVDWGQADTDGRFRVAIPQAGDYLVITAADGWRPRSRMMHLNNSEPLPAIALRERFTLAGTVVNAHGSAAVSALVVLTRQSGELVASLRTDSDGRYAMPRPSNGRYVVTVAARKGQMGARAITVLDTARDIDLTLGTPLG